MMKPATVQRFSVVMIIEVFLVIVVYAVCFLAYDSSARSSFGLPTQVAKEIAMSYGPIVGAAALGFRDVIFKTYIRVGAAGPALVPIPIRGGSVLLYVIATTGVTVAIVTLLTISAHWVKMESVAAFVGISAGIWAATIGAVFSHFFMQYARETSTSTTDVVAVPAKSA